MLQKSLTYLLFIIYITFSSCSQGHGLHLTENNITIYYQESNHEGIVKEILNYLLSAKISPDHQMHLKLIKKEAKFQLLLIKTDTYKSQDLSFEDIQLLLEFQDQINQNVESFRVTPCEIAIANNQFEVEEIPNPL